MLATAIQLLEVQSSIQFASLSPYALFLVCVVVVTNKPNDGQDQVPEGS